MQPPTAMDVASDKWCDFKQHFLPQLQAANFTDEQLSVSWSTIATYISLAWLYRSFVDEQDEATLRILVEASDLTNKVDILQVWDALQKEQKQRFWRYAKWFFNVVLT
jgi:hypothetical protein